MNNSQTELKCSTDREVGLLRIKLPGENIVEIRVRRFEGDVGVLRPRPPRRRDTAIPVLGVQNPFVRSLVKSS